MLAFSGQGTGVMLGDCFRIRETHEMLVGIAGDDCPALAAHAMVSMVQQSAQQHS